MVYRLYGWECSPYTGKVRATLHFKQIPHQDISPSAMAMKRIVEKRVGFIVMPVVITPENEVLQDSAEILDAELTEAAEAFVQDDGNLAASACASRSRAGRARAR